NVQKLEVENGETPPGPFWPPLIPDASESWRFANPSDVRMNRKGLVIGAGQGGNVLLTKADGYRKCTISLALAASKGTEAYLAIHAQRGPDGWEAVTSRIAEAGGKVRAGTLSTDFQDLESGKPPDGLVTGRPFGA